MRGRPTLRHPFASLSQRRTELSETRKLRAISAVALFCAASLWAMPAFQRASAWRVAHGAAGSGWGGRQGPWPRHSPRAWLWRFAPSGFWPAKVPPRNSSEGTASFVPRQAPRHRGRLGRPGAASGGRAGSRAGFPFQISAADFCRRLQLQFSTRPATGSIPQTARRGPCLPSPSCLRGRVPWRLMPDQSLRDSDPAGRPSWAQIAPSTSP